MIIPKMNKGDKLQFFQDLYQEARNYAEADYEAMETHAEQYKGDDKIDGSAERAKVVRNITYELIESQVSSFIPTPAVTPEMWSERNERCAKAIEVTLKNKRDKLPYENLNDMDERYTYVYGGSVWFVEWDNSIMGHNTVGDVSLSCLAPKRLTVQPNITDIDNAEYIFLEFETTKEDIVRKYGVTPEVADETESDKGTADDKTSTLYVCYYKDEDDKICQFIWSADTTLSDISDYYARKRKVCKICGKREELCECEKPDFELEDEEYEELDHDIVLSEGKVIPMMSPKFVNGKMVTERVTEQVTTPDGQLVFDNINGIMIPRMVEVDKPVLVKTKIPFYRPKTFPIIIRKNISEEEKLFGQSDCAAIRHQQQTINKIESRIADKLLKSGITPVMPEDATVAANNAVFGRVIKLKAGENKNMYGVIDNQPNIQQDIAQSERLYDQAKRILGISDSFQGQYDGSAQSGVAKQLQIQQSAGRIESKKVMKNAAHADIDKVIFQYLLAYADEPRPATYKDTDGRMQNVTFNRYDYVEYDPDTGEWYYNDEFLFSADSSADIERNRPLLWQENRQNFQSGAYGDPAQPETQLIFWLNMETAHYPMAHDMVERIRARIEAVRRAMAQQQQQMQIQQGGMM